MLTVEAQAIYTFNKFVLLVPIIKLEFDMIYLQWDVVQWYIIYKHHAIQSHPYLFETVFDCFRSLDF